MKDNLLVAILVFIGSFLAIVSTVSPVIYVSFYWFVVSLWLSYLPFAVIVVINILKSKNRFIHTIDSSISQGSSDPIIFQFVTKDIKSCYTTLLSAINSVILSCSKVDLKHYEVMVFTDSNYGVGIIGNIAKVIVVPREYKVKGCIKKARALQYAVEYRRKYAKNTDNYWVFHLDEETHITTQTVRALQTFISQGKFLVGTGPILYTNHFDKVSVITRYAESIRPSMCYICASQTVPVHMHGSNILVRADVEDVVGWANGETVAEDQLFGLRIYEKYGKVFGWHGGVVYEQPPLKIDDMLKQRKRWFIGAWTNFRIVNLGMRMRIIWGLITWFLGFLSATLSIQYWFLVFAAIPSFFIPNFLSIPFFHHTLILTPIEIIVDILQGDVGKYLLSKYFMAWVLGFLVSVSFFVWVGVYMLGLFWNIKQVNVSLITKIKWHVLQLLLLPIVGLETSAAFLAIKDIIKGRYDTWPITPKASIG